MKYAALLLFVFAPSAVTAADWPQFRGPHSDGSYTGPALVTEWGIDKNVAWKTPIPGLGWSSPIVWKGKVYLTTAVEQKGNYSLQAICLDAKSGSIDWTKELFVEEGQTAPKPHSKNSHASPTPIIDGEHLFVHFGHMGTAALDLKGKIVWKNDKLKYRPVHGNGGSPIFVGDNLVFSVDGADQQFIVALKKKTGEVAWKTDRHSKAAKTFSFSTPLLLKVDKREQIISPASGFVGSYDPKTGQELWRVAYPGPNGYSVIPQPVAGAGLVFVSTSYDSPFLLAIKPEGKGDITKTNLPWTLKKGAPHTPTPLLVGEELYLVADNGNVTCLDAKTGTVHWSERLTGGYSASPIHADGKIYIINETGTGFVLTAGKVYKEISKNELKERTLATFAASDGALYVRTESQLYKFEGKASGN